MSELAQAIGQRLKAERERRGVSAQKMADDMHLDGWVIDALEAGDYQRIGPSVYAKGHLKKYAGILGVSTAEPGTEPKAPPPTGGVPPKPIIRMDRPPAVSKATWAKLGAAAAVVVVAAGIVWWRPWHRAPPAATAVPASVSDTASTRGATPSIPTAATPTVDDADVPASSDAAPAMSPAPAHPTAIAAMLSKPAGAGVADLTPGVGRARLRLSFSADSRVDVYDYSGQRIFSGNGRANSVKTIAGIAPFRIYLGFASGVQLQVNDRAVAIGPQFLRGDVARFEAGADGVLRRDSHSPSTDGAQASAAAPRG